VTLFESLQKPWPTVILLSKVHTPNVLQYLRCAAPDFIPPHFKVCRTSGRSVVSLIQVSRSCPLQATFLVWVFLFSMFFIMYVIKWIDSNNTSQQNLTFFCVPRTSVDELSSTFYAEFRYVYRIFLLGRVSKIQRNLNVQNSTLCAHETGRNFPVKCRGI
jgi:hypothetical protein